LFEAFALLSISSEGLEYLGLLIGNGLSSSFDVTKLEAVFFETLGSDFFIDIFGSTFFVNANFGILKEI